MLYLTQCKRFVLQYGPLFLARVEKLLETNDVCTIIHACKTSKQNFSEVVIASS
jgi:saposin